MLRVSQGVFSPPEARTAADRPIAWAVVLGSTLFIGIVAYGLYSGIEGLYDSSGKVLGRDFIVFWTAGGLALDGQVREIFDLASFHALQKERLGLTVPVYPWLYPPHFLLYLLPLGLLPYLWAYLAWTGGTFAAYLWAGWRVLGKAPWVVPLLILAPTTYTTVLLGQNGFLTAALLAGGLALLDRRPVPAGILIGLLAFKPHLGLLLPVALIAAGHWRSFASAAATVALLAAVSLGAFGIEAWQDFLTLATANSARHLAGGDAIFTKIVISPYMASRVLGLDPALGAVLQAGATAFAGWAVWLVFRRPCGTSLRIAVALAATLLASPYGYHYDLPLVTLALLLATFESAREGFRPGERTVYAVVWFLPILVPAANDAGLPIAPAVLLAFLGLLMARHRAGSQTAGRRP